MESLLLLAVECAVKVVVKLQTKPRESQDKHVKVINVSVVQSSVCVCVFTELSET